MIAFEITVGILRNSGIIHLHQDVGRGPGADRETQRARSRRQGTRAGSYNCQYTAHSHRVSQIYCVLT